MSSFSFVGGIHIESDPNVSPPASTAKLRGPSIQELDSIELADHGHLTASKYDDAITQAGPQTPPEAHKSSLAGGFQAQTPNDLESSRPVTPKQNGQTTVDVIPSLFYPAMNKWRVLAACLIYFGNGMSDSALGALLPYIESYYTIGYAIVSLIWVTNAVGFISAAFVTEPILDRLGRAKTLMMSELFMVTAYVIIACAPPFPVVVVAYLLMGFGNAINLALNNVFCANLADSTVILGLAHGSYGIGGIVAPIAATALVSTGVLWTRFYLITIGIRVLCFFFGGWSFWNYEKEGTTQFANSLQQIASRQATAENGKPSKVRLLRRALKNRVTLIGALFIFSYQGAEVSESGWFISYLINYRHGNPAKVGYVTSGFWAGITVGRFTLTHIAHRVGEKTSVVVMMLGAVIFQLMSWLIPNVIGDSVSVAIVGLLLGPIYPCAQTVFVKLLPGNLQMMAISFISSAGSSGGAVVPFLTGLVAQAAGTFVLHPICIAFYGVMLACWIGLPKIRKLAAE